MTLSLAAPTAPLLRPVALVCAVCFSFSAGAAPIDEAPPPDAAPPPTVFVTGSRFVSDPALPPIGASVISADQIRRAGVDDVNAAIRKIGGVYGRQSLDGSPDFALDLRGFGATSSQNMVIVIDGVRLSDNELSSAIVSSIPIDTVERIEIIRGGASVLYGDGATGGVIQIVTKRPPHDGRHASLMAEAGQFGLRALRASGAASWDGVALDAAMQDQHTDNYRANNAFRQRSVSAGAQWRHDGGRLGLRLESARQDTRLPGALSAAQFAADPRQASTMQDFGALDAERASVFVEQRFGALEFAAELSRRAKTVKATYFFTYAGVASPSALQMDSRQTQFSPRLRWLAPLDGMLNELVAGVDLMRWKRATRAAYSHADATQTSRALYVRDELKWDAAHNGRLAFGARQESFDKAGVDPLAFPPLAETTTQSQRAWELQGSVDALAQLNLYAKAGRSYRVPNADENGYRATVAALKIQTSHDLELGARLGDAARQLSAGLFRHALRDEIAYDPTDFRGNANLDPTRRQGLEVDGFASLAAGWRVSGQLQRVHAAFTAGPNSGKEMALVPKTILSARLSWVPGDGRSADLGAQWADRQRVGDDFDNRCAARIPASTTFDGRVARRFGAWEWALVGLNLADRHSYSNAFSCNGGIYPSDGRQLKASVRYDF